MVVEPKSTSIRTVFTSVAHDVEPRRRYELRGERVQGEPSVSFTVEGDRAGTILLRVYPLGRKPGYQSGGTAIDLQRRTKFLGKLVDSQGMSIVDDGERLLDVANPYDRVFATVLQKVADDTEHVLRYRDFGKRRMREFALELDALRRIQRVFPYAPLEGVQAASGH